jgi:hypothetical protein
MAGINNFREIQEKKGEEFLKSLLNCYVIINEKVDGAFFGVKKSENDSFRYFKKSGEIRYIDRVLTQYYNPAIEYFESMPLEKRQRIPQNFYFGFEFFSRGDAKNFNYSRDPENGLVLSYIHKLFDDGQVETTVQNKEQLTRWAEYLGVEPPPIIFEGRLTDEQKTSILEFVYSDENSLKEKFKSTSFTKFVLNLLNDEAESSFLRDDLDRSLDSVVFRFYNIDGEEQEEQVFLAKMVDPLFQERFKTVKSEKSHSQDFIWLIVIDLMNFIETYSVNELVDFCEPFSDREFDEKYVLFINKIFKEFVDEFSQKYEGLILELPEYLKRPEFELDKSLIKDKEVVNLVKRSETYQEIYKILLNFFRKNRKKSSAGFFNESLLRQLNLIIDKIRNIINGNKIYEGLFPSFGEFIGSTLGDVVLSEHEAAEAIENRKKPVEINLLIGRFQPITIGHIKCAEALMQKNGKPVVLVAIKPQKPNLNSPFSVAETKMFLEKTQQYYPEIIHSVKLIPQGGIEEVLQSLDSNLVPLLWGASPKRIDDYAIQYDYIKKRKIPIKLNSKFKLIELPSFIDSKEVIEAIREENFEKFKKLVPQSVHPQFFNLKKELDKHSNLSESKKFTYTLQGEVINKLDEGLDKEEVE